MFRFALPETFPEKKKNSLPLTCVRYSPVGGCFETCAASTHQARATTLEDHALDLQTAQAPAWASDRAGSGGRDGEARAGAAAA